MWTSVSLFDRKLDLMLMKLVKRCLWTVSQEFFMESGNSQNG